MHMKTHFKYPCVFSYSRREISFYFPDFPEAHGILPGMHKTYAKATPVANHLLKEVILQYKAEGKSLPNPSDPNNIPINEQTDQIALIEVEV